MTENTAITFIILGMKFLNLVFINRYKKRRLINTPIPIRISPTEKGIQPKIILKNDEM